VVADLTRSRAELIAENAFSAPAAHRPRPHGEDGREFQRALRHVRAQEERAASVPSIAPADDKAVRSRTVADTAFSIAVVRTEEGSRPDGERLFTAP
jgi:hypothetical protein